MKALVALVGLITVSLFPGEATVAVKIRAYNATGEVDLKEETVPGTRLLLTCDVEELPEGTMVISYKWYYSCSMGKCEIQEGHPYYTAVQDTLLVDATSWEGRPRRHFCEVRYQSNEGGSGNQTGFTTLVRLTDTSAPFLVTPTSFVPNYTLITDVQQITGSNGQQWIKCTIGRAGRSVVIYSAVNSAIISSSVNTAAVTFGPGKGRSNGLYYCRAGGSQRYYVSVFLNTIRDSNNLPTPTVSVQDSPMWTLTSPDGSQVERYIVEFECRVRNMTFVEKYMSVSASGGTGRVATSVSCFGGLGQLYRVKVWAVSGTNISRQPAVKCLTQDGQCMMDSGADRPKLTTQGPISTPLTGGSTVIPSTTTTMNDPSSSMPSGTSAPSMKQTEGDQAGIGTFIGVGVGIGILVLSVVLVVVGIIVVVVTVKRRAANKKTGSVKVRNNPSYHNPVVAELEAKGLGYEYENVDKDKENGSVVDGFDPYEDVDRKAQMKNTKKPAPKESSTPASAIDVGELYAVVDKSRKGAKQKQEENGCTDTNKDDLYTVPMKEKKKSNMTDEEKVVSGGEEKSEECNDVEGLKYEPKVDSEPQQTSEGDNKAPNVDMLYAVVDKSHKKKK